MKKISGSIALFVAATFAFNAYADDLNNSGPFVLAGIGVANMDSAPWSRFPLDYPGLFQVHQPQISSIVPIGSIAAGYKFDRIPVSLELNYSYYGQTQFKWVQTFIEATNESAVGNVNTQTLMANAYYNIPTHSRFTPYIGGGLGYHFNNTSYNYSTTWVPGQGGTGHTYNDGLSWDVLAGINYALTQNWQVGVRVSYIDLGSLAFNEVAPINATNYIERGISKTNKLYNVSGMATLSYTF